MQHGCVSELLPVFGSFFCVTALIFTVFGFIIRLWITIIILYLFVFLPMLTRTFGIRMCCLLLLLLRLLLLLLLRLLAPAAVTPAAFGGVPALPVGEKDE